MDFQNWYRSKYPFIASEEEFARLQEVWKTATETEREACKADCRKAADVAQEMYGFDAECIAKGNHG